MAATIVIPPGTQARVEHLEWTCDDDGLLGLINAYMLDFDTGAWDPHPDLHAAKFIVSRFGAGSRLVEADPAPKHLKGRIY